MAFKFVLLCAVLATVNAGVTLTSTSDNTYRSHGNLAQVSTQSKSIETPYSSSNSKTDIRVNPGVYVTASPEAYVTATPAYTTKTAAAIQQPYNYHAAQATYPANVNYYQQAYNVPAAHAQHIYSAPVVAKTYYQPTANYQVSQPGYYYNNNYVHQAPAIYSAPAPTAPVHYTQAAPIPHQQQYVRVAYSPAAEVAHLSYTNVNDHVNYAW